MFSTNSIRISSSPDFHVFSIEMMPDLLIFLLLVGNIILHYYYFIISSYVSLWYSSIVNMNLSEHFHILVFETN